STRLHVYTSDLLARLEHIDGDCHVAPFVGLKGAHADDLARVFLAAIVANRNDDGVFPWGIGFRVPEVALDSQCGECRLCASFGDRLRVEAQVVLALRAHARAFENRRLAVRARACPADRTPTGAHESDLAPFSSQPNSARPRMREPAATVSEPALRSPLSTPVCSSSTRAAASMLPSSSPPTMTVFARTPPVTLAPASIVKLPCTWTSPLKLPAMRTCPDPSILPSIVSPAARRVAFAFASARDVAARCRAGTMSTAGAPGALSVAASGGPSSRPYWSFHNAMTTLLDETERRKYTRRQGVSNIPTLCDSEWRQTE